MPHFTVADKSTLQLFKRNISIHKSSQPTKIHTKPCHSPPTWQENSGRPHCYFPQLSQCSPYRRSFLSEIPQGQHQIYSWKQFVLKFGVKLIGSKVGKSEVLCGSFIQTNEDRLAAQFQQIYLPCLGATPN